MGAEIISMGTEASRPRLERASLQKVTKNLRYERRAMFANPPASLQLGEGELHECKPGAARSSSMDVGGRR
jgi:hypothetical protein